MNDVALLAELAGFSPTDEDRQVFNEVFAVDSEGFPRAFHYNLPHKEGAARQLACCVLGWLYLTGERRIVWTTHKYATAYTSFEMVTQAIERSPELSRRVAKIRRAYGAEEIRLKDGSSFIMRARVSGTGRGFVADRLILMEQEYLTAAQYRAYMPVMAVQPNSQIVSVLWPSRSMARNISVLARKPWRPSWTVRRAGAAAGRCITGNDYSSIT